VEKRLTFAYGRTLVTSRIIVFVTLAILATILIVFTSSPISAILGLTALLAAYLVLFAISPLLTQHWITRSRVILRQGWYFRAMIPFSSIDVLVAADDAGAFRTPLGISRPFGQPVLFVTGGRTNLMRVRLRFQLQFDPEEDAIQLVVRYPELRFVALTGPQARGRHLLDDFRRQGEIAGHLPHLRLVEIPDRKEVCGAVPEFGEISS